MSVDPKVDQVVKSKAPPPIPKKPKELKAKYASRSSSRQSSPAAESIVSRETSVSSRDLRGLSSSTESLSLIEQSSRPIPENYYGKQVTNLNSVTAPSEPPSQSTNLLALNSAPPLPPRALVSSGVSSYYGQPVVTPAPQVGLLDSPTLSVPPTVPLTPAQAPAPALAPTLAMDPASSPSRRRSPLPPIPVAAMKDTSTLPPPKRLDFSGPKNLILDTKNVNHRPPAIEGPPNAIKRGLSSLSIDEDFICMGGSSCSIVSTHSYEDLWFKSTDKVAASLQVGREVWLGMRDGRICVVEPGVPGYAEENGKHHNRAITRLWLDDGFVIAVGADSKVSVWDPQNVKSPRMVHRIVPAFKSVTYSSPFLWVMKGRQVHVYDPLLKRGSFLALPHAIEYGERTTSTVGEYSCGSADSYENFTVLGHNDGTISLYRELSPVAKVTLGYSGVLSIVKSGPYHWIGLRTGKILVVEVSDKNATLLKEWKAHSGPVTMLVNCESAGLVLSGSPNDSMKTWESGLSQDLRELEIRKMRDEKSVAKQIRVQIFTWNVGCANPKNVNEHVFWREFNPKIPPDVVVFGLQEVVELDNHSKTAKNMIKIEDDLEPEHKNWRKFLWNLFEEDYELVVDRALVGLYSCVFVSAKYSGAVSNISTSVVKTGLGGLHGNKGGTIIRLNLFDSSLAFINVHLAAGQSGALQRNKDAEAIMNSGIGQSKQPLDHDYCFFFGDTNYRINTVRENANKLISTKSWDKLYSYDQLGRQLTKNPMFVLAGFHEMPIKFPPTYKFDVGSERYDSSDKQRIPSWCDRVLYRGENIKPLVYDSLDALESDHRPVMGTFDIQLKLYSPGY